MQLFQVLPLLLSLPQFPVSAHAEITIPPADPQSKATDTPSPQPELILRRNAEISSKLATAPPRGVKKMSADEGEKFFLDYWDFTTPSSGNVSEQHASDMEGFSPAHFVAQSYPFGPSYSLDSDTDAGLLPRQDSGYARNVFAARNFMCPLGTWACTSIGRSDRCCGSGETCEIVADTGHGTVGCCPSWKKCSGMIGSCVYITVITVTIHSTVMLSTVTYSTKPENSASTTSSSSTSTTHSSQSTTTNDSLAPPDRPTGISTVTSATRGDDVCPTGFYACSAVYHGGCCRTGRDCDTTSCPVTVSTTIVSDGVTIVAPVATPTGPAGGNQCARGWFHCADTVGGGCCPVGFACGTSCTATDTAAATTVAKAETTSSDGVMLRVGRMMLGMMFGIIIEPPSCPTLPPSPSPSSTSSPPVRWLVSQRYVFPALESHIDALRRVGNPHKLLRSLMRLSPHEQILVMYPLDVLKTRIQLQTGPAVAGVDHYNGMFDCFRKIVKNEGASRLYRGISAPILMEAPKRATKFAANDSWGAFYRNLFGVEKQTQGLATLTGATAGATEAFVVVPFELVKIRLQDKAQAHKYNGMLDVVRKIVAAEGPLAMYNGLESTMWRHILWNAGYFGCIFQVRAQLPAATPGNKNEQMRNDLIAGTIGGITGTILNTPMDVVKSRIQNTSKVAGQTPKYNWAWPALGTVIKEEGFSALYKGFTPKVLRLGPGGGILLVVFTGVMDFFRKVRGE
ncbi:uncharacterized protein N7515_000057 [Penicillium bovifimosum]|uniref:Mitochondrial thiamine pyrophosphate carrier 1 n=1 Tax=Penicillium bovifimosum TaxID=126998 RepID=A0A9W9LB69_9EURO|nr:uncharacterized protein N7515_000057 [Penicillium bovifimosum]KAJ5145493.1 hypothetical protein N7515_000057 [Penicillium bovifimosum]